MRVLPQWYQLAPSRLERECRYLVTLPYFQVERTYKDPDGYFGAVGMLRFTGYRSGRQYFMRCRLEYPRRFPSAPQHVFDHNQIFAVGANGHLLTNHALCLTLPERGEFSLGAENLTEQVLGAALVWFHKRVIYEHTGKWPGPAERHGASAVIDLLVESGVAEDATALAGWLATNAATPSGRLCKPNPYAPCPCGSGTAVRFCHGLELKPLFDRLACFHGENLVQVLHLKADAQSG